MKDRLTLKDRWKIWTTDASFRPDGPRVMSPLNELLVWCGAFPALLGMGAGLIAEKVAEAPTQLDKGAGLLGVAICAIGAVAVEVSAIRSTRKLYKNAKAELGYN